MIWPIITENTRKLPIYIVAIGTSVPQEPRRRGSGFDYHQLFIVLDGTGRVECNGESFSVCRGDIFFLRCDVAHAYHSEDGEQAFSTAWISFDGMGAESILSYFGIGDVFLSKGVGSEIEDEFMCLRNMAKNHHPEEKLSERLYRFIISFFSSREQSRDALSGAMDYIHEHYCENVSLDDIASFCGMAKYTLCRKFKQAYSSTPFEYIMRLRVNRAKTILSTSADTSIAEVARLTGFSDSGYFCRTFRRFEATSPARFRKENTK